MFWPSWTPFASLLFLLLWSTAWGRTAKRSDVYIAGFFPYGDGVENSYTGRGVMPSVKLALGHVNEHGKILANYRLHMWWNDTQVSLKDQVLYFLIHLERKCIHYFSNSKSC